VEEGGELLGVGFADRALAVKDLGGNSFGAENFQRSFCVRLRASIKCRSAWCGVELGEGDCERRRSLNLRTIRIA